MRVILVVLCAITVPAFAQDVRPGQSTIREQATELLQNAYRRPEVAAACMKDPEGYVTIRINGSGTEFTVSCRARSDFFALLEIAERQRPQ